MKNKMTDVRNHLIAAIEEALDPDSKIDKQKLDIVAKLGNSLINSAKVELAYRIAYKSKKIDIEFIGDQINAYEKAQKKS